MTRDALRIADPELAAALDRLPDAAPLKSGFADRVVAKALRRAPVTRRIVRRRWMGRRGMAIGIVAMVLTSAAAAGIGVFQPIGVRAPAIERLVKKLTGFEPVHSGEPPTRHAVIKAKPKSTTPPRLAEMPAREPAVQTVLPARRELLAERLASRVERTIERRDRLGLPVPARARDPNWRPSPAMAARNPRRAALIDRVQEIRASRAETPPAASNVPDAPRPVPSLQTGGGPADQLAGDWPRLSWRERMATLRSLDPAGRRAVLERLDPDQREELMRVRAERHREIGTPGRVGRTFQHRFREGIRRNRR